jgi:hypothetical protein
MKRIASIVLLLSIPFCPAVIAQTSAGMGAIGGVVTDPSGAAVAGATVVLENPRLGIHRDLTATGGGIFNAPSLVPNSGYQVTITAPGFARYENRDITVQVGQNVNIQARLEVSSSTTQVEVAEQAPIVDQEKTDVSQVIDQKQIDNLPINGRRVDQFVLLTPGVVPDGTYGDLSFRGIGTGNTFLLDGNDTTDQFYNENGGRTRIATSISQDAVQEFQVLSDAYSAEYGRTAGGVVNTVTRSGTNQVHGTGFWFFRNRTLDARDPLASFNPSEVRHQFGGTISGPIVKDKLFFLFNTEEQLRDFPLVSSIISSAITGIGAGARWVGCGVASGGLPAAGAQQCNAINGLLPSFFTTLPRSANQQTGFGKIDWRPTDKNSFSFSLNYQHYNAPNGIQSAIALTNGAAFTGNGNDDVQVRNGRAEWTYVATPNMVNEARFGWFKDRQADFVNSSLVNPNIGTLALTVAGQSIGFATYIPRIDPSENRFEYADNLSWTVGKHSFKFGVDYLNTEDYYNELYYGNGSYTYSNANAFALDYGGGGKHYTNYQQAFGNPVVDTTLKEIDGYAQDQYRARPNLTLYYGVRYEKNFLPQPPSQYVLAAFPQTGRLPQDNLDFAPRVGFAYNVNNGNTVIRGGYGIYYGRYPAALLNQLFVSNTNYTQTLSINNTPTAPSAAGPVFPNLLASATAAPGAGTVQFAAPGLRTPYTQQADFAVEQKLTANTSLTVSYMWDRGAEFFTMRDLNYPVAGGNATYRIFNSAQQQVGTYSTPVYLSASKLYPAFQHVYETDNGGNSYYNGLSVQVQRRFAHGFTGSLAYTWSHAIDDGLGNIGSNEYYSSPTSTLYNGNYQQAKGDSNLDQRQRLAINWVWSPTFTHSSSAFAKYFVNGWQLATITTIATGSPQTETVSVQTNPTGLANNGYITGFNGTSQVPFLSQNTLRTDDETRVDARVSKMFALTERFRMTLQFEAFNLTNTVYDTSINTVGYYANWVGGSLASGYGTLTPYSVNSSGAVTPVILGRPTAYAGFPDGTNARRAQASVRFEF